MDSLIHALFVGFGAGLVLHFLPLIDKRGARREQVSFLRRELLDQFVRFAPMVMEDDEVFETDEIRLHEVASFLRWLRPVVEHRASAMAVSEICDLHRVLAEAQWAYDVLSERGTMSQANYNEFYWPFAGLDWLDLPQERVPWEMTDEELLKWKRPKRR